MDDVWLLKLVKTQWIWKQIKIINNHWAAPQIWCHPACRVGSAVVIFSRASNRNLSAYPTNDNNTTQNSIPPEIIARQALQSKSPHLRENNSNAQRENLNKAKSTVSDSSDVSDNQPGCSKDFYEINREPQPHCSCQIQMAAFRDEDSSRQTSSRNRMKQLDTLKRLEARYKNAQKEEPKPRKADEPPEPLPGNSYSKKMNMYVADISEVLASENGFITWKQPRSNCDTVLHSLGLGKGELIIFGGVQKSISGLSFSGPVNYKAVSNTAHFITAPRTIVWIQVNQWRRC